MRIVAGRGALIVRRHLSLGRDVLRGMRVLQHAVAEVILRKRVDDDVALRPRRVQALPRLVVALGAEHVAGAAHVTELGATAVSSHSDTVPCWMTNS